MVGQGTFGFGDIEIAAAFLSIASEVLKDPKTGWVAKSMKNCA